MTAGNNAPVAVADTFTLAEDAGVTPSSESLLSNDADADAGDVLAAVVESAKATSQSGLINIAADGDFTYDPPANLMALIRSATPSPMVLIPQWAS